MEQNYVVNGQIKAGKVTLIIDGENKGIVNRSDALRIAETRDLDLVQIGFDPPVCKLMNFEKFRYEQKKKQKKQKATPYKEIRLRMTTAEQDLQTKLNKITQLILKGCYVRASILLKGRERNFRDTAVERIRDICTTLKDIAEYKKIEHSESAVSALLTPKA